MYIKQIPFWFIVIARLTVFRCLHLLDNPYHPRRAYDTCFEYSRIFRKISKEILVNFNAVVGDDD